MGLLVLCEQNLERENKTWRSLQDAHGTVASFCRPGMSSVVEPLSLQRQRR